MRGKNFSEVRVLAWNIWPGEQAAQVCYVVGDILAGPVAMRGEDRFRLVEKLAEGIVEFVIVDRAQRLAKICQRIFDGGEFADKGRLRRVTGNVRGIRHGPQKNSGFGVPNLAATAVSIC